MKLNKAIKYMNAAVSDRFDPALLENDVSEFAIDSRDVRKGVVFFVLSQPEYKENGFNGEFEDAHQYIPAAFENGAIACVVRRDRVDERREDLDEFEDRFIFAEDVIASLQNLARGVYKEWNRPVVAITGSAGKTTAKELTAFVLEAAGKNVLRNIKNYNNGLGHPLTVLNLASRNDFDVAVLEMGMSTPMREIARLCSITPPDFAVGLNVLPVHIEHLGSIENVARAKAELVEGMKPGGTAVLNADDERILAMSKLSKGSTITYGIKNKADVWADGIASKRFGETRFQLHIPEGVAPVTLHLPGRHNIMNALAAAAVGFGFGMTATEIAGALTSIKAPPQRGEVLNFAAGFTVINDSYNSNPNALLGMVETLVDGAAPDQRKIVVAGEMLELGPAEKEIHIETGQAIAESGIDLLIGVRGLAAELTAGAKSAGLENTEFFENSEQAGRFLAGHVRTGDLILVKGSRGVRTERVIDSLLSDHDLEQREQA